jgi:hypothetical protein
VCGIALLGYTNGPSFNSNSHTPDDNILVARHIMETTTGPVDHIADEAEERDSSGVGPGASASSSGGAAGPQQKGAISDAKVAQSSSFNLDFAYSQVPTLKTIFSGYPFRLPL